MITRIVRLHALLRVLKTLDSAPTRTIQARNHLVRVNSAPTRTIQARNHLVRVPAVVHTVVHVQSFVQTGRTKIQISAGVPFWGHH